MDQTTLRTAINTWIRDTVPLAGKMNLTPKHVEKLIAGILAATSPPGASEPLVVSRCPHVFDEADTLYREPGPCDVVRLSDGTTTGQGCGEPCSYITDTDAADELWVDPTTGTAWKRPTAWAYAAACKALARAKARLAELETGPDGSKSKGATPTRAAPQRALKRPT